MVKLNPYFNSLKSAYIFPVIEKKLAQLEREHPNTPIINLGVGDVSLPLAPAIARAIQAAVEEMTLNPRGYGPCDGYPFLKETICARDYAHYGITPEEIFISSGTNPDASAIQELFHQSAVVGIPDPSYPVYRDATLLSGKTILTLPASESIGFIPKPPKERVDLVYLCTPANPTGVAMNTNQLQEWIDWAFTHEVILVIDNVYNAFITSEDVPPSVYALPRGKEVAIELRSFSKSAGFTGLRCSSVVVPKTLHAPQLHSMWAKRCDITTNGIAYPIQAGAAACYTFEARNELRSQLETYQASAKIVCKALKSLDQIFFGGVDSPYIWWKTPNELTDWEFFDQLLNHSQIVTIPGSGFGACGEGYVRLSCFISEKIAKQASHALHHHFVPA